MSPFPPSWLRYVVLHHTEISHPHFDLMVETSADSALATWRCQRWPPGEGEIFTRIGEHRRDYLEYEGPVSGGRGRVTRIAMGRCQLDAQPYGLRLRLEEGGEWRLPGA